MSLPATYHRFQPSSAPPVISNAHIHSFAINELTRELLYVSNSHITLVSLDSLAELKRIPFSNLIRTESIRQNDRKFQEVLQQYVNFGLNFLNSMPHLNIWLGVINKRRVVCLSEELEVSNEVTLDSSGVMAMSVHPTSGDVFVLGVEGKVFVLGIEYSFDAIRKRLPTLYDFEIKVNVKKQIGTESLLTHIAMSFGSPTYLVASAETTPFASQTEVHVWNYTTGEKTHSVMHGDGSGQGGSVVAMAACGSLVALADSNKALVVYDFITKQELARYQLGAIGPIEGVLVEDPDISAGVYVIDTNGKVYDFVLGSGISSTHTPGRPRDTQTPSVSRNPDRGSSAKLSTSPIKPSPHYTLITLHTGMKQLWLLVDGFLEVVNLASIGRVTDLHSITKVEMRYETAYFYYGKGNVDVYDPRRERVTTRIDNIVTSFTDREHPEGLFIPAFFSYLPELNFMVYVSVNGLLKLYDLDSEVASINFVMQKKTFTSACFIPLHGSETTFDCVFGTSIGEILILSYDKLTREVTQRRKYAAHDQVVMVSYLHWVQKVMTIGREGSVRFLTWPDYRWDNSVFRGFWSDCTACTLCGTSILLIGYESGMLQTLYLSFASAHPAAALLEYHIFAITCLCGLPNSNSEAVSGDSAGFIVLWNLDYSRPYKIFSVHEEVSAMALFGSLRSERLLVVMKSLSVFLSLRTKSEFVSVSPKEIAKWREDRLKKRTEYKGRKLIRKSEMRSSSLTSLEEVLKRDEKREIGAVSKLLKKVRVAKSIIERDPLAVSPHKRQTDAAPKAEIKKMTDNWYRTYRNRPLTRILEHNRVERLKRSVSKVIKHLGVDIPSELAFSGKVVRKFSPALSTERLPSRGNTQSRMDFVSPTTDRMQQHKRASTSLAHRKLGRASSHNSPSPLL